MTEKSGEPRDSLAQAEISLRITLDLQARELTIADLETGETDVVPWSDREWQELRKILSPISPRLNDGEKAYEPDGGPVVEAGDVLERWLPMEAILKRRPNRNSMNRLVVRLDLRPKWLWQIPWEIAGISGRPLSWPYRGRHVEVIRTVECSGPTVPARKPDRFRSLLITGSNDHGLEAQAVRNGEVVPVEPVADLVRTPWNLVILEGGLPPYGLRQSLCLDSKDPRYNKDHRNATCNLLDSLIKMGSLQYVVLWMEKSWVEWARLLLDRGVRAVVATHFYMDPWDWYGRRVILPLVAELERSGRIDRAVQKFYAQLPLGENGCVAVCVRS